MSGVPRSGTERRGATDADAVVRGGTVVTDGWRAERDVHVRDGRVVALTDHGSAPGPDAGSEIDASGALVLPGGVDPHCHVGFTSGAYTSLDDYRRATTAAVAGGTTTIVDFAIPRPGQRPIDAAHAQRDKAADGVCDSALHASVVDWDDTTSTQLRRLVAEGVVTVKMFTTYRGETMADADTILAVMAELAPLGGMLYVHCEANHLIEHTQRRCAADGEIAAGHHHRTRPEIAETASVAEILAIAEALDVGVYFVHQSTPEAVDLVQAARQRGVRAYSETVAHHLTLSDDAYGGDRPERFVCCPPLRPRRAVERLGTRVAAGRVDTIGSDHCCYDSAQKREVRHDVRAMPNGLPGVETRMPVVFDAFVASGAMDVTRFVELTATAPARLNGLYPRKGSLLPGADADIVVWDAGERWTVRAADLHMATDYTPYEGREVTGRTRTVLVRGRVVVADGAVIDDSARGRHVPATPFAVRRSRIGQPVGVGHAR